MLNKQLTRVYNMVYAAQMNPTEVWKIVKVVKEGWMSESNLQDFTCSGFIPLVTLENLIETLRQRLEVDLTKLENPLNTTDVNTLLAQPIYAQNLTYQDILLGYK